MLKGDSLSLIECTLAEINQYHNCLSRIEDQKQCVMVVRSAFSSSLMEEASRRLSSTPLSTQLKSPNQGMPGGELLTLGAAATPTMTALNGPSFELYLESAVQARHWEKSIFGELNAEEEVQTRLAALLSALNQQRPSYPASFDAENTSVQTYWLPFNYRILPPGVQIYSHHDMHYRLPIYDRLAQGYRKDLLLSWFVTAQSPQSGGELIIYGLRSDDPLPPMLPTRFMDTEALERDYHKLKINLQAGDLVLFNSGLYVHRVSPVQGEKARITFGGFATLAQDDSHLIYWS